MKYGESVSKLAESYVDQAEHEGGDALVADPGVMRQVLEDFALFCKYTVDADVHDEMAARGDDDTPGGGRLHVLTEEEYIVVFDHINNWGPAYLVPMFDDIDSFDTPEEKEDFDATMEAQTKLLKRMVEDRGGNTLGD
jgi:hypothetical protein